MPLKDPKARPGTAGGMQGFTYETKIVLLFMIRACLNKVNFTLYSNIEGFGNFDDVVADCEFSDGSKLVLCVQTKHLTSENNPVKINKNNLIGEKLCNNKTFKSNDSFNLCKYYKQLCDSKKSRRPNFSDNKYIIFTTAGIDSDDKEVQWINVQPDEKLSKLFDTSGKNNCVNQFSTIGNDDIFNAVYNNEFLENICIFSSQCHGSDIDSIIKKDLSNLIGNEEKLIVEAVFNNINVIVNDWYIWHKEKISKPKPDCKESSSPNESKVDNRAAADDFTNKKFLDFLWESLLRELPYLSLVNELNDHLKIYRCTESKMYEEISNDIPVVINTGENANMLALLEYYTTAKEISNKCETNLESFMFVKFEHLGLALDVFRYCRNIIFIDCSAIDSKNCSNLKELQNILSNDKTKRAVLFIPNTLIKFAPVPNTPKNYTFNYESLKNFNLPIKVKLQGYEVEYSDLFALKELSRYLDTEAVEELLSENIIIGKALNELDAETEHCYLERTYNYRQVVNSDIFNDSRLCDVLFVSVTQHSDLGAYQDKFVNIANVDNISSHSKFYHICDVREENRNKLQHLAENFPKKDKNIHWLQITPDCVLWQDTVGSVQNITKYVKTEEKKEKAINEDKFLENANQINLIVDKAGMGKTTSLIKIAHKLRTKDKNCWIEHINLSSSKFTDRLLKMKKELKNKANDEKEKVALSFLEDFIICRLPKLSQSVFKYLSFKKQVIFLFDGFDEICPKYEKEFKIILKDLMQSNPLQIWLTSRSHMVESLQKMFPVFPVNIQPFDKNNQIAFYKKYFKKYLKSNQNEPKIDQNEIWFFSKALQQKFESVDKKVLDTMGIPLLTKMFAKIATVKFAKQNTDLRNVDISVHNIFDLYKNFFDKSIERFLIDKKGFDPSAAHFNLKTEIKKYMNIHNLIAAKSLLEEKYISLFSSRENYDLENTNEEQYQIDLIGIGIVSAKMEDNKFLHFTFAEFLFANFIIDKLQSLDNTEVLRELLDEVLYEDKWKTVRIFMNYSNSKSLVNPNYDPTYKFRDKTSDNKHFNVDTVSTTSLIVAAEEGNCNIAEFTINCVKGKNKSDVKKWMSIKNEKVDFLYYLYGKFAALHLASYYGYNDIVKLLLNYDVDYNQQTHKGHSALMIAAREGNCDVVTSLLTHEADVNLVSTSGETALIMAAHRGHCDVVTALLTHGANVNHVLEIGETALMLAAKYGHCDVANALLTHEADVNHVSNLRETALTIAAEGGHCDVVTALLTHEANANHVSKSGETALILAAQEGHCDIMTELIKYRANVNLKDTNGYTAILHAASWATLPVIKQLFDSGASLEDKSNTGSTFSLQLAKNYHHEVLQYFITTGRYNIHDTDKDEWTASHHAALCGHCLNIKLLLDNEAELICPDNTNTPNLIDCQDNEGRTALHVAVCYSWSLQCVQYLLQRGADRNITDNEGKTARDFCNDEETRKWLRENIYNTDIVVQLPLCNNDIHKRNRK